jgi:hypothetical protein
MGQDPRGFRFLHHLDLLVDQMNQNSSFVQFLKSDPQALTSDSGSFSPAAYGLLKDHGDLCFTQHLPLTGSHVSKQI